MEAQHTKEPVWPTSAAEAFARETPGRNPSTPQCKGEECRLLNMMLSDNTRRCNDCGWILLVG